MTSNSSRLLTTLIWLSFLLIALEKFSNNTMLYHQKFIACNFLFCVCSWRSIQWENSWLNNLTIAEDKILNLQEFRQAVLRDNNDNIAEHASSISSMFTHVLPVIVMVADLPVSFKLKLILIILGDSVILYSYCRNLCWRMVKRESEMALRLSALCSDFSQESGRLRAIAGTSGGNDAERQVWTSEASLAQLHDLLEKSDLNQLEKHIGRLRNASKRLNNVTRQIHQSWTRRIFDTFQSCFSLLKAAIFSLHDVRLGMSSSYSSLLHRVQMYWNGDGVDPPSSAFDQEVMHNLHEAAKRVVICPLRVVPRMRNWESSNGAQDLVDKAETAMESIRTLIGKVPESKILPGFNFDKVVVVAYWEFSVSNFQKATTTTTPEVFLSYDSNTLSLPFESLLGYNLRKNVPKSDLSPGGCFRGKLICC